MLPPKNSSRASYGSTNAHIMRVKQISIYRFLLNDARTAIVSTTGSVLSRNRTSQSNLAVTALPNRCHHGRKGIGIVLGMVDNHKSRFS
jgi:hypothetical protein